MKLDKIVASTLLILIAISCAKDKGNYAYSDIRRINVKNIRDLSMVSSRELTINPSIFLTLGNDTLDVVVPPSEDTNTDDDKYKLNSNLSFCWEMSGEKISDEMNLKRIIKGSGKFYCRYVVTDNDTGISYYYPFYITLTSPFAAGYFALAKAEDNRSILTFKSTRKGDEQAPIINVDNINGRYFGSNPVYLGIKPKRSGPTTYTNYTLYISCENDGEGSVFITDLVSFEYLGIMDKKSVVGIAENYKFRAEANNEFFNIISGKVHKISNNMFYAAAAANLDYYLAPWIGTGGNVINLCLIGFDNKNGRFLHFVKDKSRPAEGYVADPNVLDRATQVNIKANNVEQPDLTKGHHLIAGSFYGNANPMNQKAITSDNKKFYFYSFAIEAYDFPFNFPFKAVLEGSLEIPGINENSCARLNTITYDWYLGIGNKLYTTTSEVVKNYKEVFTLPEDSGDIVTMELITKRVTEEVFNPETEKTQWITTNKSCALVATYNPQATGDLKGSIYVVNLTDNTLLESYPNCTGKAVSVFFSLMQ